jgi:hypothetical protein
MAMDELLDVFAQKHLYVFLLFLGEVSSQIEIHQGKAELPSGECRQ